MEVQEVAIKSIIAEDKIQQREQLSENCIEEYADAIADGANFPPIDVYDDGENLFLADGFHRVEAYRQTGIATVAVTNIKVPNGTRYFMLWALMLPMGSAAQMMTSEKLY